MPDVQEPWRQRRSLLGRQGAVHGTFPAQLAVGELHHELHGVQTPGGTPELGLHAEHPGGL
jgi:hypothetical protein